jgi:hypothetical protein
MTSRDADSTPPRLTPWPREVPFVVRALTFFAALTDLLWMDICRWYSFRLLRLMVARTPLRSSKPSCDALTLVRVATRDACVAYWRQAPCLQRSAVVTRMLRRRGVAATMVIGYQASPLLWHAWVEVDGKIIWDHICGIGHFHAVDRI